MLVVVVLMVMIVVDVDLRDEESDQSARLG